MTELWRLTAREITAMLRRREVSPLDLIAAAEARIAAVDPLVNALPIRCFDRARAKASRIMDAGAGRNDDAGYLHGLPIVIKDLTAVEGVRWTEGSSVFADRVADHSDIVVETLEANGAIVIAKSNTPEFGAGGNTVNGVFGATLNPWDTRLTSGGSSGGSAAALAAGEAWLATGTDMAGSIRYPAAFCSVVGLRPSPGRVAHGPRNLCFGTFNVDGPMARNVADVASDARRHGGGASGGSALAAAAGKCLMSMSSRTSCGNRARDCVWLGARISALRRWTRKSDAYARTRCAPSSAPAPRSPKPAPISAWPIGRSTSCATFNAPRPPTSCARIATSSVPRSSIIPRRA